MAVLLLRTDRLNTMSPMMVVTGIPMRMAIEKEESHPAQQTCPASPLAESTLMSWWGAKEQIHRFRQKMGRGHVTSSRNTCGS